MTARANASRGSEGPSASHAWCSSPLGPRTWQLTAPVGLKLGVHGPEAVVFVANVEHDGAVAELDRLALTAAAILPRRESCSLMS